MLTPAEYERIHLPMSNTKNTAVETYKLDDLDHHIMWTIEDLGQIPFQRAMWVNTRVSAVCYRLVGDWGSASTIKRRIERLVSAGLLRMNQQLGTGPRSSEVRTYRSIRSERHTFRG